MSGSRNPNLGVMPVRPERDGDIAGGATEADFWRKNLGRATMPLGLPRHADWWTGLPPEQCAGYSHEQGQLHSLDIPNLATCTRQSVLDYFNNTWTLNELLFSSLIGEEPFYRPPYHSLRHPLIFYYVHPSVLYVSKLRLAGLLSAPINIYFESLFETGVDEMSWDDMSKNAIEWPSIEDGREYRRQVYLKVREVIETDPGLADGHAQIGRDNPLWAIFMGMEHERIHLETSSVLIRELPVHLVARPPQWPTLAALHPAENSEVAYPPQAGRDFPQNDLVTVSAREVAIGKDFDFPTFGWDNEYGSRNARVGDFAAGQMLISNGEYWQFVADGGYLQKENWSETGWRWRSFRNVKWPTFWVPDGPAGTHQYRLRTCFEIVPMQWDWPAVVNYHEAQAFCKWKSLKSNAPIRLITEAEHQAMILANSEQGASTLMPAPQYNSNLRQGSECPVDASLRDGANLDTENKLDKQTYLDKQSKFADLFGNVWQWAEDHFHPLEGFKIDRLYDDFSLPCFDGEHQMILGGSFISTGDEATAHARFHFRPHFFQHAGFRVVCATAGDGAVVHLNDAIANVSAAIDPYETQTIFDEYMTLHYAPAEVQMPYQGSSSKVAGPAEATQFPQRCADLVSQWCDELGIKKERALDIGCAVGGASFRLASAFAHVEGIDLSGQFIAAAQTLQREHKLEYRYKVESDIYETTVAAVDAAAAAKANFQQGDACNLPSEWAGFDAVLMANLLCRLPDPEACLKRMSGEKGVVRQGGLLVLVSPYSWMTGYTPKDKWLGGYLDSDGNRHFSEDGLKALLSSDFELLEVADVPLVIREHRRKFQYIVAQAMVWRRK
jgi:5-histidylcysteine sulfoxide synthase/putative 4-mercaptohistidine N1-methyltranferase